jgi:hypothetical protein
LWQVDPVVQFETLRVAAGIGADELLFKGGKLLWAAFVEGILQGTIPVL